MDDYIGGRYSSSSCVGAVVLSLAFGPEVFAAIMDGAAESDALAKDPDIRKNAALLDALIGVYERNACGYLCTAVLPYSQALSRFPAHLQQLDMESNGKSVNRFGEPVNYVTGPVIFGEPGTNGQHSFYQLLHQGTDIIPLQFVGFRNSQMGQDVLIQGSTSQQKLGANVAAQIVAFACGKEDENRNKYFPGGRHVLIDKESGTILKGLSKDVQGKTLKEAFKELKKDQKGEKNDQIFHPMSRKEFAGMFRSTGGDELSENNTLKIWYKDHTFKHFDYESDRKELARALRQPGIKAIAWSNEGDVGYYGSPNDIVMRNVNTDETKPLAEVQKDAGVGSLWVVDDVVDGTEKKTAEQKAAGFRSEYNG